MIYFKNDNVALFEQILLSDKQGNKTMRENPRTGEREICFITRFDKRQRRSGMTYNCKSNALVDDIKEMLYSNMKRKDIAEKLNLSDRTLYNIIKRFNLA